MGGQALARWGAKAVSADGSEGHETLRELCHDLRHPSATIRALAAALEIECDLPERARQRLNQIVAEARRIDLLCSQVLSADADENEIIRLDHVVAEVVWGAKVQHQGLQVLCSPVLCRIDGSSARRIVGNLIDNACRAAGQGGCVLVSVWSTKTEVRLEVSDDGPGFGAAPGGTAGLGLSIVHSLVARFGGRVEFQSSDSGGATVVVILPVPHVDLVSIEEDLRCQAAQD